MVSISWERRADDCRVAVHPSNSRFSGRRRRLPYVDSPSSHSSPPSSSTSFFATHHKVKKAVGGRIRKGDLCRLDSRRLRLLSL